MAQFEQYENLPGVKVNYEDGNLQTGSEATDALTQSILIIGTAVDGPVGEPVSVNAIGGPKEAEKLFGGMTERVKVEENGTEGYVRVPHEGSLVRAMWEALRSGNEDVRLLRVSGKTAKTELPAQDPNSEVVQPLVDALGDQMIPGNISFSASLELPSDHRLVKIENIEEYEGEDTTGEAVKVFPDRSGYSYVDDTPGSETVFFNPNVFRPKNTVKVNYKASKRNYIEVTRNEDGTGDTSTKGLLTQDTTMTNYFASEVGNWSDDPIHQVNVYVVDAQGDVNTIPSVNSSGERMWRIGRVDQNVVNELTDPFTSEEFKQGGIRFTSAYQEEVANGLYPALNSGVKVVVDYFYYNDIEVTGSVDKTVPGTEKVTALNFIPESDTLEVYYEVGPNKVVLEKGQDYTIVFPTSENERAEVRIQAGAGPVGAKLFAHYKTGESSSQGAKLIVNALHAGKLYGGFEDEGDIDSLTGVTVTVEYDLNPNGTIDMENRVIRFTKPADKRATSSDRELVFKTKDLRGIRTLREFANYVNSLPSNNIVSLEVPVDAGNVSVKGLIPTDYSVRQGTGQYDYRPIHLGERFNVELGQFALYVDNSKLEGDPERYPWVGDNGFFNIDDLADMRNLYEILGGKYELVPGTLDEFDLVEQGIYSKLENYTVDVISLAEVHANTAIGRYADDGSLELDNQRNFATQLAQHCAMVTAKAWETIGVIGVAPAPYAGLREVQDYIDLLTKDVFLSEEDQAFYISRGINPNFRNVHNMYNLGTHDEIYNDEGEPIDIGPYVNVVFGPEVGLVHERIGNYVTNGASVYGALITRLNPEVSTTNQQISAIGLRYNLSESQQNQLSGGRFVTFESKITTNGNRMIVVKDGVTAARATSDYNRLSTIRITHLTVQLIRQRADKFIGLPNGVSQRNSLATEIQASLDRLKELGVLQNFSFSIYSSARDRVLGNAFIELELVPAYELRKIYTNVALRASL